MTSPRAEIAPIHPGRSSCTSTSFAQICAAEHRKEDAILDDVAVLCGHASYIPAAKRFGEFRRLYEKHVAGEERVLFPLFLEKSGDPDQIVNRLRDEHDRIGHLVDATAASISSWDHQRFGHLVAQLSAALHVHNQNETQVLHPSLDALVQSASDWARLCGKAGVGA